MAEGIFGEVVVFVATHRLCDRLSATVGPVSPLGYDLRLTCPCGAVLERRVSPGAAVEDLVFSAMTGWPN
jgi:hypothetical protein